MGLNFGAKGLKLGRPCIELLLGVGLLGLPLPLALFQAGSLLGRCFVTLGVPLGSLRFERFLLGLKFGAKGLKLGRPCIELLLGVGLLGLPLPLAFFQAGSLLGRCFAALGVPLGSLGFERFLLGLNFGAKDLNLGRPYIELSLGVGLLGLPLRPLGFERFLLGLNFGAEGVKLCRPCIELPLGVGLLGLPLPLALFQAGGLLGRCFVTLGFPLNLLGFERFLLGLNLGAKGLKLCGPCVELPLGVGLLGLPLSASLFQVQGQSSSRLVPFIVPLGLLGSERFLLVPDRDLQVFQLRRFGVELSLGLGPLGLPLLLTLLERLTLGFDFGQTNIDLLSNVLPSLLLQFLGSEARRLKHFEFDATDAEPIARLECCIGESSAVQQRIGCPATNDRPAVASKYQAMQGANAVGPKTERAIGGRTDRAFGGAESHDLAIAGSTAHAEN